MLEIEIDGRCLRVAQNTTIIEAADQVGIYIPRFCYHKKLSIAANCRMCLVEVEKSGKPLPACATPVTAGMKIFTTSAKAKASQRAVMEFLLINHPLDCPICDQGGECELQDLSLGYGQSTSYFHEAKRSVKDDHLGSLIATEMTRCIQCTRCVRFGQEIAGIKELGTLNRGENLQISTYVEHSLGSELSGNIIDLCPVGALTSKPFRFTARAWELNQFSSIAPHDCLGSNVYLHVRRSQVMRVVPRENEAINETWLTDRDRYSYLALQHAERLTQPYIKENGQWLAVDWQTALATAARGFKQALESEGPSSIGAVASPNCTTEEFYLLQKLWRALGSENIDHRLHQTDMSDQDHLPIFPPGISLSELEKQTFVLLIGSNIRREQPLLMTRLRKMQLAGTSVASISCLDGDLPLPQLANIITVPTDLVFVLAGILQILTSTKIIKNGDPEFTPAQTRIAKQLTKSKKSIIVLGAIAHNHPQAAMIRQLVDAVCERTNARCIWLTEGANSAGAWLAGAVPHRLPGGVATPKPGLSVAEMFANYLKAYLLVNIEPELDCANPQQVVKALSAADCVVALSSFKANALLKYAHVMLPMASFTETKGSFINAMGHWQHFEAAVTPLAEAKSGYDILQNLAQCFVLTDVSSIPFPFIAQQLAPMLVLEQPKPTSAVPCLLQPKLSNEIIRVTEWPIYRSDGLLRRSVALQQAASNDRVGVAMNSSMLKHLGLQPNQRVNVKQSNAETQLSVILDERLPDACVWIPAGYEETAVLSESFGPVEIYAE